jgi:hypothetical protein
MTYDSWKLASPPYHDNPEPPEEIDILLRAAGYLRQKRGNDNDDAIGEAIDLIDDARSEVEHEYKCPVCDNSVIRKGMLCSANCARAMADDN